MTDPTALALVPLDPDALRDAFGLGVAGNFAGHLEQAGEAADFAAVEAAASAPKGIFPWYAPAGDGPLAGFPLSSDRCALPAPQDGVAPNLQIEPEAGVLADVEYDREDGVVRLRPRALAAFDDCSIRRPGARRISEKKHWGAASKGVAATAFEVTEIDVDGATADLRLASFLRRDGVTHAYGIDSPVAGYSYYGATLLDWIAERLRSQREDGPLEDVGAQLRAAGSPAQALVGIGATRYTPFGESTFLEDGDVAVVVLYDGSALPAPLVEQHVATGRELELSSASVLSRKVVAV